MATFAARKALTVLDNVEKGTTLFDLIFSVKIKKPIDVLT